MRSSNSSRNITLLEFMATIVLFSLSFYIFAKSFASTVILKVLTSVSPFNWSIDTLFVGLTALILLGYLYDTEGGGWPLAATISWILLLPSLLGYSNTNFLGFFGISFNLGIFKPNVPIPLVLGTGILLAAGDLFFFNMDSLQWIRSRLSSRGAPGKDIDFVIWKDFLYLSGIAIVSAVFTLGGGISSLLLAGMLTDLASKSLLIFIVLPAAASLIISITILLYLRKTDDLGQGNDSLGATELR
jgi:hypothetical protein